jgi:hypothetical protein
VKPSGDAERDVGVVSDDDDVAPAARPATHKASPRAAAEPAEPDRPSTTGISAAELSKLWHDVGTQLGTLPRDKNQDLWRRYELLHYGSLMSATPAQRDEAAAKLRRIAAEASRLGD